MRLLKKLIRIPSFSGKEKEIKDFIFVWGKKRGLPIVRQGKNLLIHFKGRDKKALIFNAHLDTILPGSLSSWKTHPFKPVLKNGRIYGLGTSDEKASVVSLLLLAEELKDKFLPSDVFLSFVVREESDARGTQDFIAWFKSKGFLKEYQEVGVIICEPNSLKRIEIGHKGGAFIKVTAFGDSGHGSEPEKIKKHAVWQIFEVTQKIKKAFQKEKAKFADPILGKPTLACLTSIKAGDLQAPNKFSDKCEATFDLRTSEKMHQQALEWFRKVVGTSGQLKVEFVYPPCPFAKTKKNERIVKITQKVLPKAKLAIFKGACDLGYFTQINIPGIILGPGERKTIHKANEYVLPSRVREAVKVYEKLIDIFGE